jgi:anaerobic magnesium-protoporphyrin IX monomethyl ester cyclase
MTQVLITNSYFYPLDQKQWRFKQPYPPLGTLLAASVIRKLGHSIQFVDNSLEKNIDIVKHAIIREKPRYVLIYDDGFSYLTKMCLTIMREACLKMIREAKGNNCVVIISSSDASDHYEKYLDAGADFVVRGEGEETLSELITVLENNGAIDSVKGIAWKQGLTTIVNEPRTVIKNLNALPMPSWDLVKMDAYRSIWKKHHGYFSLNIATTRGCPYKCNWCAKPIYGNRYNSRSPEQVVEEIEFLLKTYQPDHFWVCDDIFGLKPGWLFEFNSILQKKRMKIKYKIQSRADLLLEENTVEALVNSGAETVWVGAESGSQKVLDAMDKGINTYQIAQATALLKARGIKVAYFLQFGYSGETKEDIQQTIKMVLKNMPDEIGISVSYPLPGTKFYERVKSELKEKRNWVDSDDLDLMFQSTYSKQFYKNLQRHVHQVYRMEKARLAIRTILKRPLQLNPAFVKSILSGIYHFLLYLKSAPGVRKSLG